MILITGGAGYIGTHTLVELLQSGEQTVVIDNLCNSSAESLKRAEQITGQSVTFYHGDIRDRPLLDTIFAKHDITSVIHFAGLKAVGESVDEPLKYYDNNVHGTQVLLQAMVDAEVFQLVFSSSATVYGEPTEMPISESCPTGMPTNPYGRSKLMVEDILRDLSVSDSRWSIALLRYFNPVGAHNSGLIGEAPNGIPNNLLPYICRVAQGKLPSLSIFGNDYPTADGTGIRDYIHVVDLAKGHLAALNYLQLHHGVYTWNLGTGHGHSVLDVVNAFEKAARKKIEYHFSPRRAGDIAECWADPDKALSELGWKAELDMEQMMKSTWNWQLANPNGYK